MDRIANLIVGSGPAGVSAAFALLARGRSVTMIDGGKDLEPALEARRLARAGTSPDEWSDADRTGWQSPQHEGAPGQIRRYGSDFAMEPPQETFSDSGGIALRASRAAGGLSNLWGSAVLPYAAKDMAGWPISPFDLAPHYKAVAAFMPVAGQADALADLFPAFPMPGRLPLPPSLQAQALVLRLTGRERQLAGRGIRFGLARQAVTAPCRLCAQCLHGCPYGLIWSARHALAALRRMPGFDYRPGGIVRAVNVHPDSIVVRLADGTSLTADHVFLGAGVLETARILLASGLAETLTLRDSQQAFLPTLHRWSSRGRPDRGGFHTLAQMFLELDDPTVSEYLVHAQVYTWNEFYARDLVAQYGRRMPFAVPVLHGLARRLIVAQAFLHSDHSHRISLTLAVDGRLNAAVEQNPDAGPVMARAIKALASGLRPGGLVPLTFAARPGPPGASFHVGASVPMAKNPAAGQSDRLGRPAGANGLHLIDATSLPAIPATTITFSVMANAHRIGTHVP